MRWWWQHQQPDIVFSPTDGWSLRCPKSAVEGAFHLQLDAPPQVAEFHEFLALIASFRDPLFFDLGCHFGLFSFAVLDRCGPNAGALAVDPSGTACAMVQRIASANGWNSRLRVLCAAAGRERGEIEMVDTGAMSSGYFVLPTDQPARDRVRVPVRTIDDLAEEAGTPQLIKIDVEGFEGEVLAGGERTLANGSCLLFVEFHNLLMRNRGVDPEGPLKTLARLGYADFSCAGKPVGKEQILATDIIRIVARRSPA